MKKDISNVILAIEENNIDFLESKIGSFDIDSRIHDEEDETILMHALSFSNVAIINFLLNNGASINKTNNIGETIIHSIVYSGDPGRLEMIYERYECNLNASSKDGTTPLLLAAGLEKFEVFKKLLELGANVNLTDEDGNSPIHICCSVGALDLVKLLVEKGALLNGKTKKGNLPLALAVNNEHHEVVKYLFKIIYKQIDL